MDNALRSDILPTSHAQSNVENRTKYHHLNVSVAHVQTEINAQNSHFRHEILCALPQDFVYSAIKVSEVNYI